MHFVLETADIDNAEKLNKDLVRVLSEKNKLLTSVSTSMKASKMDLMASSLAHEINQPLCAIRLNSQLLLKQSDHSIDKEFIQENLRYLISDVDRINTIVNKIKQFFRNDHSDFKEVNLFELVQSVIEYIQEECETKNISIETDICSSFCIQGDVSQLQMVLLNLLNNAIDILETHDADRSIALKAYESSNQIELIVEDSGPGVPANLTESIFDLFNTTKSKGMGVGLWLSRAVMENHHGHLLLSHSTHGGARFLMRFSKQV